MGYLVALRLADLRIDLMLFINDLTVMKKKVIFILSKY